MKFAKLMVTALLFSIGTSHFSFADEDKDNNFELRCNIYSEGEKTRIKIKTYAQEDYNIQFGGSKINSIYVSHDGETIISNHTPLHSLKTKLNSDMHIDALELTSAITKWYEDNKADLMYIKYYEVPGNVVARFMRKNDDYESWLIPIFRPNHSEVLEFKISDCNKDNTFLDEVSDFLGF